MSAATIEYECPGCGAVHRDVPLAGAAALACDACHAALPVHGTEQLESDNRIDACPACGGSELYAQRDFNRKLGLAAVVVAVILAIPTRGLSLLAAVVIDLVLHRVLPAITICYRCRAIIRGVRRNPAHGGFDMAIEDKYREIRARERA